MLLRGLGGSVDRGGTDSPQSRNATVSTARANPNSSTTPSTSTSTTNISGGRASPPRPSPDDTRETYALPTCIFSQQADPLRRSLAPLGQYFQLKRYKILLTVQYLASRNSSPNCWTAACRLIRVTDPPTVGSIVTTRSTPTSTFEHHHPRQPEQRTLIALRDAA